MLAIEPDNLGLELLNVLWMGLHHLVVLPLSLKLPVTRFWCLLTPEPCAIHTPLRLQELFQMALQDVYLEYD